MKLLLFASLCSWAASQPSQLGDWKTAANITIAPRQEHATVALDGSSLAIVGGIVPNEGEQGVHTTNLMQIYNCLTDSWSSAAEVPIAVNHPNVAVVDGKMYLLGGLAAAADGAWQGFSDSWVYSIQNNSWSTLPPMPDPDRRGSAAVGVYKGVIYLAGGLRSLEPTGNSGKQDTVDIVSSFDTRTQKWKSLPPLPEARDHSGASVVKGRFYVVGGRRNGQYNVVDTVFVLELDNIGKGWRLSSGRMPTTRGGIAASTINGVIYTFGGEGNPAVGSYGVFPQVEMFDVKREKWTKLQNMPYPRHGGSSTVIGGAIHLPGGGRREGGNPQSIHDVFYPIRN